MGRIKETKLDNGNIGLEITYGGVEAPFGGIDTSAPPMYIDPKCFVNANGFLVIENQLVACGWLSAGVTLESWSPSMGYLTSGSFYQNGQYWNFVLASQLTGGSFIPPFTSTQMTYYIWTWTPSYPPGTVINVPLTAQCTVYQYAQYNGAAATPGTGYIQVLSGESPNSLNPGTLYITVGSGVELNVAIGGTDSPATVATNIAAAINGASDYPCTAAVDPHNSFNVILTATSNINPVLPVVTSINVTNPFAYTFTSQDICPYTFLNNQTDASSIYPITWTTIGETVFFSGFGNLILAYSQSASNAQFRPITQYLGANVLTKFNGQLIAAGVIPGPGQAIAFPEMVIAWSAPNAFGQWNPENADGTVTGAGFNQIDDISDYLTGLLISSGVAIILRTQGIDYITPLSGGVIPFDFVHISNAIRGEGCQDSRLVTQYDQIGFFVGNSNIYQFSNSLSSIGDKIKNLLIPSMGASLLNRRSLSGTLLNSDGNIEVLFYVLIDYSIFVYNPSNQTWMILTLEQLAPPNNLSQIDLQYWMAIGTITGQPQFNSYMLPVLSVRDQLNLDVLFYYLNESVQNSDFNHAMPSYVTFPQEEIAFGRDITVDGALISCAGVPGQVIEFTINGQLSFRDGGGQATPITGSITLPESASPLTFQNYQVTFNTSTNDKITVQNPQLTVSLPLSGTGTANFFSAAKIALFASYDPNQRPL